MISTTYLSSATDVWSIKALEELLERCRLNNAEAGITGVLLYAGGNFIQTLEGPSETVDRVMEKVRKDPRHKGVYVLRRDEITERDFAGWSMGFRQIRADQAIEIPGFTDYLRTGQVEGASGRQRAVVTFHRVFRDHMREPFQP